VKSGGSPKAVVRIYVTGNLTVNGDIQIDPDVQLQLFVGGTSMSTVTGTKLGTVYSTYAKSFQYYGLPNNTTLNYNANGQFKGTYYAPNANLVLGGGGTDDGDFRGTYIIYSALFNGHYKFHFDESLPKLDVYRGYIATSWQEL